MARVDRLEINDAVGRSFYRGRPTKRDTENGNLVLTAIDVDGGEFKELILSSMSLENCEFENIIFNDCAFENCNFGYLFFTRCTFVECSFIGVQIQVTVMSECVYRYCRFSRYNILD